MEYCNPSIEISYRFMSLIHKILFILQNSKVSLFLFPTIAFNCQPKKINQLKLGKGDSNKCIKLPSFYIILES